MMTNGLANAHLTNWALFGASGVTGRMVLARALARGHRPTLVGRDLATLRELAAPHGLSIAQARLDDRAALQAALAGHCAVMNVAGPFSATAEPLLDAAFATGTDYLDLNGELPVLQRLLDRDRAAKAAGRVAIGGVGFGVAATDGLALQVSTALGGAEQLRLSVATHSAFHSPICAFRRLGEVCPDNRAATGLSSHRDDIWQPVNE